MRDICLQKQARLELFLTLVDHLWKKLFIYNGYLLTKKKQLMALKCFKLALHIFYTLAVIKKWINGYQVHVAKMWNNLVQLTKYLNNFFLWYKVHRPLVSIFLCFVYTEVTISSLNGLGLICILPPLNIEHITNIFLNNELLKRDMSRDWRLWDKVLYINLLNILSL